VGERGTMARLPSCQRFVPCDVVVAIKLGLTRHSASCADA
jgi:hypothetical protein